MQATRYNSKKGRGGGEKRGERWLLSRIHCEPITMTSKMDSYDWPFSQETRQMEGLPGEKKGFVVVQSLSCVRLFVTPWIAARQASLSFTISQSLLKFMSIELAMPSNHLVLCCPLLLLPCEQTKPLQLSWLSLKISSIDDLGSPVLNIRKRDSIFVSVTEFKKVLDILFPFLLVFPLAL